MNENEIRELTGAEEEVMQVLWKIEKGFVKNVLAFFDEPKPAYNTVSTIIRILEDKGFVSHKVFGNSHEYFPRITKQTYSKYVLGNLTRGYFSGSFKNLVSFMAEEDDLSIKDIEEIEKILKSKKSCHD